MSAVTIREGTATGLITDIVDAAGDWRYLEDLRPPVLLSEYDVRAAAWLFDGARWASVQLQQPAAAVLTAAVLARQAGCRVLLDGASPDQANKEALLSAANVVRADAREAELLTGNAIHGPDDAARAAAAILGQGPTLVALAVGDDGNYFAWRDPVWGTGELLIPRACTRSPIPPARATPSPRP